MSEQPIELPELVAQLGGLSLFAGLGDETLTYLAQHARWRRYAAGVVIFLEGEPSFGLCFIQSGGVKIVKTSPEGREQVLRHMHMGDAFNEISVFVDHPNPATAIALETTTLWVLQHDALVQLLDKKPEFARQMLENMANHMIHLVSLVADLSLRSVTGRLARLLLEDAVDGVLHRPRWYTQTELAARLGTVPDVIQRALSGLVADGVIEVKRHQILIRDRVALEALIM